VAQWQGGQIGFANKKRDSTHDDRVIEKAFLSRDIYRTTRFNAAMCHDTLPIFRSTPFSSSSLSPFPPQHGRTRRGQDAGQLGEGHEDHQHDDADGREHGVRHAPALHRAGQGAVHGYLDAHVGAVKNAHKDAHAG